MSLLSEIALNLLDLLLQMFLEFGLFIETVSNSLELPTVRNWTELNWTVGVVE